MNRTIRHLLLAGLLCATTALSTQFAAADSVAGDEEVARACALRDLAAFSLIEWLGFTGTVPSVTLANASLELQDARRLCDEGRTAEAFVIYDRIDGLRATVAKAGD